MKKFFKKKRRKSFTKGRRGDIINEHSARERTLKTEQKRNKHNVNEREKRELNRQEVV